MRKRTWGRIICGLAEPTIASGEPITVRAHPGETGVVIGGSGQGPGIPVAEQSRIFEKCYRGRQSRPGEGATFSFTLPVAHEEASL